MGDSPDLQLIPGKEYVFRLTVPNHPLYITNSPGTIGTNVYSNGVVGNGNNSGILRFTVPQDAPPFLYYQSGSNPSVFGTIKVVKVLDNLEVVDSTSANTIVVDTFGINDVNTAKYLIQMKNTYNNYIHSTEILVLQDGTDAYLSEYSTVFNDRRLGSFDVAINSGALELRYTPAQTVRITSID